MVKKKNLDNTPVVIIKNIEDRILTIRGKKVMVDADLADLYGVTTKRLNEQVRRNIARFPEDFMFKLTGGEKQELVAKCDHFSKLKFSKYLPNVFTEHDGTIKSLVTAIKKLTVPSTKRRIGFGSDLEPKSKNDK